MAYHLLSLSGSGPLRYWDPPMNQYLGIDGAMGRFLGFFAVFMQAAVRPTGGIQLVYAKFETLVQLLWH